MENSKAGSKKSLVLIIAAVVLVLILSAGTALFLILGKPAHDYGNACEYFESGVYTKAYDVFDSLGDYKDSAEKKKECSYQIALGMIVAGDYEAAYERFDSLGEYKDSREQLEKFTVLYEKVTEGYTITKYTYADDGTVLSEILHEDFRIEEKEYDEKGRTVLLKKTHEEE